MGSRRSAVALMLLVGLSVSVRRGHAALIDSNLAVSAATQANGGGCYPVSINPGLLDMLTLIGDRDGRAAVPVGSESLYNLRDGGARISVISRTSPPAAGASLTVTGTIHVFQEGDGGPEETIFPVVMREGTREPSP